LQQIETAAMDKKNSKSVAIIVAHPDDETLWAGGTVLSHPLWNCFIVCLCRKSDLERATKFSKTLQILESEGIMGDTDDGPDQNPLNENELAQTILKLLPSKHFDLIITHSPNGEYTKHLRHEETGKSVIKLWREGKISAKELWLFAYEDHNKKYLPKPIENASATYKLSEEIWQKKYKLITETYGFEKTSFEAQTTPKSEAFWQFTNPADVQYWLSSENKTFLKKINQK
jgi:LmbE family N-acetylglucosaminyl deacetylase